MYCQDLYVISLWGRGYGLRGKWLRGAAWCSCGIAFYKPELVGYFDDKKEIVRKQARTGLSVMAVPVVCMVVSEIVGYIVYIFTKAKRDIFGWRLYAFGLAGIIMAVLLMRSRIPCNFITVTIFTFIACLLYGGIMNIAAMMMNSTYTDSGSANISWEALKLLYITGAPYDAMHAGGAAVCAFLW